MSKARWILCMLALFAVLSACGGGGSSGSGPTAPMNSTVTITVKDFAFSPQDVTINPGDSVRWVWAGPTLTHTVTAEDGTFDSGMVFTGPGTSYQVTFNQANQTINYHCATHWHTNGMQGAIKVGAGAPPPKPGY
jgi:plastocyanin